MSFLPVLLAIAGIHWAVMVTPGPNTLLITQSAAHYGRRTAQLMALGIAVGAGLLASLALLGLSVVLAQAAWLLSVLKIVGGAYLIYLGGRMLWKAVRTPGHTTAHPLVVPELDPARALTLGFLNNLSNPKALVFIGSIFSTALTPDTPLLVKVLAVAVVALNSLIWHMFLATAFSLPGVQQRYRRVARLLNGVAGGVMSLFGVKLIASAR